MNYVVNKTPVPRRSHAGAWIETQAGVDKSSCGPVAPTRERGLKQKRYHGLDDLTKGRSHAGAWIETPKISFSLKSCRVAPTRERGLKCLVYAGRVALIGSLPRGSVD